MRKKGLITLLVILLIAIGLSFYFTDAWVERQIEDLGSAAVGARVELDGVDVSPLSLSVKWQRLQVTDPDDTWRNLIETGETSFDLAFEPLLYKRYIIENVAVKDVRVNTKRERDGAIPESEKKASESKLMKTVRNQLKKETDQMPVFNLNQYSKKVNVDSLWKLVDLRSPQKIDSLKSNYTEKFSGWEKRINDLPDEKELKAYQTQIESIKPDQIKDIKTFQSSLKTAKTVYKELDSLHKNLKSIKKDFQADFKSAKTVDNQVKDWIAGDYQKTLKMAKLPEVSVKNAAKALFGNKIITQMEAVIGYINTFRYYAEMFSGPEEEASPPRFEGQDIHYTSRMMWPEFWVKRVELSGETPDQLSLAGTINNIVSDQKIINQPTEFALQGRRKDLTQAKIDGIIDYRGETKNENINLALSKIPLNNMKLTDFALLPKKMTSGKGLVNANLNLMGSDYTSEIKFEGNEVAFDLSEIKSPNSRIGKMTKEIAASIKTITFDAKAKQTSGKFNLAINSNLDNLIASKMKEIFSKEVGQAKKQLEHRLQKEVFKYQKDINQFVTQKEKQLRGEIEKVEAEVEKQRAKIDAKRKEIEDKIAAEKKKLEKKLEKEAKDKLKGLFK